MASPVWQASTQYPTGSIVQRASTPSNTPVAIVNAGFESGAVDWNFGGDIVLDTVRYQGANALKVNGTGTLYPQQTTASAVTAGTSITASCMYLQGSAPAGVNKGRVCLIWYTSGLVEISKSFASSYITSSEGGWKKSTVTATAPATAAFVKIAGDSVKGASDGHNFDNFVWNLTTASPSNGLEFKAVQSGTGTSAGTEPTWPVTLGLTVVDGTVTWEAITLSSVTWTASPDLISGATEPTWVTGVGNFTIDGSGMQWEAISRIVDDPKCPQKTVLAIGASKVFCGDDDIMRFSATVNPLDWTSERDAGYLPTGLQQAGANNITVSGLYRQNLVVFNANCFQMWQIDPDPENMALLDQMQGIGSLYQQAAQEVADELFFLSAQGVRTIGLSASSESLQSGDVGSPVDSLIVPAIKAAETDGLVPRATYYTGAGQYWLTGDLNTTGTLIPEVAKGVFVGTSGLIRLNDTENVSTGWVSPTVSPSDVTPFYTSAIYCIANNGSTFVLGGNNGFVSRSTDSGVNWTNGTIPTFVSGTKNVEGIAYGNSIWVAIGTAGYLASSPDGVTWTSRTSVLSGSFIGRVVFGNGCFIATGSNNSAMRSTDGINWSLVTLGLPTGTASFCCEALIWTGSMFIAAANNSQNVVTSPDGITWSVITAPQRGTGDTYNGIAWSPTLGAIITEKDGNYIHSNVAVTSFTQRSIPSHLGFESNAIFYGGKFMASDQSNWNFSESPDGINWTLVDIGAGSNYALGGQTLVITPESGGVTIDGINVFVYTQNQIGKMGSWSRYAFPFVIDGFATLGNKLYMRGNNGVADNVYMMDEDVTTDDGEAINGIVQWQWNDFGTTGTTKMLETVDIVGDVVAPTISIGYDQTNPLAVTTPYQLQIDSMCGFPVPIPVSAPTFSIKLEYAAGGWELQQFNVEVRQNWKIR